jgi:hypothetical protein
MIQVGQDSFSIAPDGYNVWTVHIPDGVRYNCSVSVTDGDASIDQPEQITQRAPDAWDYGRSLTGYYPELRYWDTSYLTWQGEVQTDKGKPVRGGELILFSADDSSGTPHAALLPIGEDGRVQLTRGYFFDTIRVSYQLNTFQDDPAAKKVQLALDAFLSPRFTLPERFRWKDTSVVVAGARRLFQDSTEAVIKELPAVTVEADRLDFLERQYARGLFTEPTQYRIDLRDTVVYNLWMCLRKHLEGFQGGTDIGETPSFNGHQTIFFVDGVRKSVDQVDSYWYEEMAYAKAYNSFSADASAFTSWVDGGDTIHMAPAPSVLRVPDYNDLAAICIFTRKGKDIRSSHHGLHQVSIPGYTRVAPWSPFSHGLSTLYWNPSVSGGDFVVRFRNRGAASYRLCVEGVARDGRVIHYEKILCGGPDAVKRQILRHRTPKKYLGNL